MPYFGGMMGRPMVAPGGLMQGWGRPGQMPQPNVAPQAQSGIMQMPMQPMQPGGFGSLPGPVAMPQVNPGVGQMPMPNMQPGGFGSQPGGFGAMPQYRNLGFGPQRWV